MQFKSFIIFFRAARPTHPVRKVQPRQIQASEGRSQNNCQTPNSRNSFPRGGMGRGCREEKESLLMIQKMITFEIANKT